MDEYWPNTVQVSATSDSSLSSHYSYPTSNIMNYITSEEYAADKRAKNALITATFAKKCASSSSTDIPIFQKIHQALQANDGSKIQATVLSGGVTNYSYKISVTNHPHLVVFAKLCFEYMSWDPDNSAGVFDLQRTTNEYTIMKIVSKIKPDCVVAPLALWDMEHEGQSMKLLITEWAAMTDEQIANQFIEGIVDVRVAPKLADTLAAIHTIPDIDPNHNEQAKVFVVGMMGALVDYVKETSCGTSSTPPKDRTEKYMLDVGSEIMIKITKDQQFDYRNKRDCLQHGDSHVFNILVEAKPSIEKLEAFGPNGAVVQCDWELAFVGPKGLDVGVLLSYPIMCQVVHALNGHTDSIESINKFIVALLDRYEERMVEAGKTPEEISDIMRSMVGWCGCFHFQVFYFLRVFLDTLPVNSEADRELVRDSMGILGLKLIRLCYDKDFFAAKGSSSEEVRQKFMSLVDEEVTGVAQSRIVGSKRRMQARKSSMLRANNRRVSDAAIALGLSSRGLSSLSLIEDSVE